MKKKYIYIFASIALAIIVALTLVLVFVDDEDDFDYEKYYNSKLEKFEKENQQLGQVDVIFLGDSLTDLCDLNKFYPNINASNRGISGDTTTMLNERLQVSAFDIESKVIVLLIGVNNINTMMDNYEDILIKMQSNIPNTKVILCSLTAMGGDHLRVKNAKARENNIEIERLAQQYGYIFLDLYNPLFNNETGEIYQEYTVDGVHFTDKGYEVVSGIIAPAILQLLNI